MTLPVRSELMGCIDDIADKCGYSASGFVTYKESLTEKNCFNGYSAKYPQKQVVSEKDGKMYVDNMKIMAAETLYKNDVIIKLTAKTSTAIGIPQPPIGWWASEKWDGIRALWDGEKIVSRGSGSGKPKVYTYVPDWFIKTLPPGIPLDGEIWIGRGLFQKTSKLSNIKPGNTYSEKQINEMWSGKRETPPVVFKAFDIPGLELPFEKRMNRLHMVIEDRKKCWELLDYKNKTVFPLQYTEQTFIDSMKILTSLYRKITSNGAEGLMIRAPNSPYEQKRSKYMLKYKIKEDSEAIVRSYIPGTGRLEGLLGSLKCELIENGKPIGKFTNIGTGLSDIQREEYTLKSSKNYIPKGSIVSFSYMEMTKDGIPRHPVYRGVRYDFAVSEK